MIRTDSAIILHGRKFSDTSKILQVYTRNHGKISILAKGVRSSKSKFGSSLEVISCSTLSWYHSTQKDLYLVKSAEQYTPTYHILSDYHKLITCMAIAEVLSTTQENEESHPELFDLTHQILQFLNSSDALQSPYNLFFTFLIKTAHCMGFGMSFHKCNITGELIDIRDSEYFFFSYYEGSILSLDIDHSGQQGILMNSSIVSILQKLDTGLLDENSSFNISSSDTFTIHDFLSRYFSIHSHKKFTWRTMPPGATL